MHWYFIIIIEKIKESQRKKMIGIIVTCVWIFLVITIITIFCYLNKRRRIANDEFMNTETIYCKNRATKAAKKRRWYSTNH